MRTTSSVTNTEFPFAEDKVPFILVVTGDNIVGSFTKDARGFEHASTHDKKQALVERAIELSQYEGGGCTLLAAWPGAHRTDVFEVDDLNEALAAFA